MLVKGGQALPFLAYIQEDEYIKLLIYLGNKKVWERSIQHHWCNINITDAAMQNNNFDIGIYF